MHRTRRPRSGAGPKLSGLAGGLLLPALLGSLGLTGTDAFSSAEARSHKRRERDVYECKPATQPSKEDLERANRYWDSGFIFYASKEYDKARSDFENAYNLTKSPDFLINLSKVCEKLSDYACAIKNLEAYLQECPGAPDAPTARQRLDDYRVAQAIKEGEKPPVKPVRLPPTPSLVLMGAGAALLITGAGLGGASIAASKDVSSASHQNQPFSVALQATEKRGRALESAAIALDVIGAIALGVGVAWTASWAYEQKNGLSLALAPTAGGFVLSGRY